MPKLSAKKSGGKSHNKSFRLRKATIEKPFTRRYRTEVAVTKLINKQKTLWNTGMDSSEWFTHKGTILWTFQQYGVSEFFIPKSPTIDENGATIIEEEVCPASRDSIDIDAEVQSWMARKKREEQAMYRQILGAISLLPDNDGRDQKVIDCRIRHIERQGTIKASLVDMKKEITNQEKQRRTICETFDDKLKDCAVAIAKCFHEQFVRDYEELLSEFRFREFFIRVDEVNSNRDVGQTKSIQSLQEIQLVRYSNRVDFSDNMRHFDTLLSKHEGVGGVMDDETKKYYLFQSVKESDFPDSFAKAIDTLVTLDKITSEETRLTYDKFLSRIMTLHRQSDLEETIEANSITRSSTEHSDQIASVKHTNKTDKKGKSKEIDLTKITCYACGLKGHFRGAPECRGKKTTAGTVSSDKEVLSLETEFSKATANGKKGK
jgi:hypothetical protein